MSEAGYNIKTNISTLDSNVRVLEQQQDIASVIKVAAYCRVSTVEESQQQSLDTQIEAYERVIKEHPGWVLAGIYVDKGISGTSVKNRKEFLRMIADAKSGKIQYILAKSISRFARNTVDVLAYVRELKSYGVSVLFEKEKIDTGDAISEFVLSVYAASAQEEIVSLSNNMRMGRRMRYAEGIIQWTHLYGLRCSKDGSWVIDEEEAKVIRRIFYDYVSGKSTPQLEKELEAEGVPSMGGQAKWYQSSISEILRNEKYAGDLLMQKTYTVDPITHERRWNRNGELKQYYKENHHPAIVPKEIFQMTQLIAALRNTSRGVSLYPFYGFLKCPICGANMVRFNTPRDPRSYAWTCAGKATDKGTTRKDRSSCPPFYFLEEYVYQALWEALETLDREQLTAISNGRNKDKADAAAALLRLKDSASEKKPRLEYKDLYDTVEAIDYPQWTVMKVSWKCGLKSTVEIRYKQTSDYPCVEVQSINHMTKNGTSIEYLANGKPMPDRRPDEQAKAIRTIQKELQELIITEPEPNDINVLKVRDGRCIRKKKAKAKEGAQHESTDR